MRWEHWRYSLPLRLRSLFRREQVDQDLDDEMRDHLEHQAAEFRARGMSDEAARRQALRALGGLAQTKEEIRDTRGVNTIDNTIRDLRYSLRVLAKSPGFTVVAVLTLALAIGANAVAFGILNAMILRPLDLPQAESLYGINNEKTGWGHQSYPDYLDLRDRNRSFDGLAAYNIAPVGIDADRNAARAWVYEVTANYFDALRIQPQLGRFFHSADEHGPNSAPYVVLTWAYWHSHFHEDADIAGRVVRLNKHPYTVLGVAPPEFHGTLLFFTPDMFVPIVQQEQIEGRNDLNDRGRRWVFLSFGHLKDGVTPRQAVADLNSLGGWLEQNYPKQSSGLRFSLARPGLYADIFARPARAFLAGLMLLAGLILLAACANLGSLFAARAADRGREVALRLALGAGRSRILRQLFTEALIISVIGGAVGLWASVGLLNALSNWQVSGRFPMHVPVHPDANVYAVALLLAIVSGLLFGLVPVRQVLRVDPYQIIKAGPSAMIGRRITVRDFLLVVQVAICALLVTSSIVAVRGLARSMSAHFGFEPRDAMLVDANLSMAGYAGDAIPAVQKRMRDAVAAIPGVKSAGLVDNPPLVEGWAIGTVFHDETTDLSLKNQAANPIRYAISPDYFDAASTALLSGRALTLHDDRSAPHVAIVNREFTRRVLGGETAAVGKYFKMRDGMRVQVVGIVEDGKYTTNITEAPQAALFLPILQWPSAQTWLVVRSARDPRQLAADIRRAIRAIDGELPVFTETWSAGMDGALFATRVATVALGVLGAMGAMLSITGIFGMAAYSVSKRLKELGVRLALGAGKRELLRAGLGRAVKLLAFGSTAGMTLGVLSARVLAAVVYQATPREPVVLGGVIGAMMLLGLAATWIPARRALRLDPAALLREE